MPAPEVIVGDVLDFALTSDQWPGEFGWVAMRLHEARYQGEPVYFIRTDASDEQFARENDLLWVPLLVGAKGKFIANRMYIFDDDRPAVIRSIPGEADYLSLFELIDVTLHDRAADLGSAERIETAAEAGLLTLASRQVFVNYPLVKWPGGELAIDESRDSYLGTGQLLEPVDTADMVATLKLHEGFPGDRYITIDTSAVERAPDMHIAPAGASWSLVLNNMVDVVFVFSNGIPGPGVMGYQPAVFGSRVDSGFWSPFWNHFTIEWIRPERARILHTGDEVYDAIDRGEVRKFNGVPDSHPNGFVVNCPIPILADNTFGA